MVLKGRRQVAASRVFGFEEGSKQNAMLSEGRLEWPRQLLSRVL